MRLLFETERLLLRPVREDDALATSRLMNPRVARYLVSWVADMTEHECGLRIRAAQEALREREDVVFAIVNKVEERLMGWVGLARDSQDPARARLGYWIGNGDEGRGFVSEAVGTFLPKAAALLRIEHVEAWVHHDNPASIGVLEKQGFAPAGTASVHFPASGKDEEVMVFEKRMSASAP